MCRNRCFILLNLSFKPLVHSSHIRNSCSMNGTNTVTIKECTERGRRHPESLFRRGREQHVGVVEDVVEDVSFVRLLLCVVRRVLKGISTSHLLAVTGHNEWGGGSGLTSQLASLKHFSKWLGGLMKGKHMQSGPTNQRTRCHKFLLVFSPPTNERY